MGNLRSPKLIAIKIKMNLKKQKTPKLKLGQMLKYFAFRRNNLHFIVIMSNFDLSISKTF